MSDKLYNILMDYASVLLTLIIGLVIIKVSMIVIKKGLKKTRLDPLLHKLVANAVKVTMLFVLTIMTLEGLGVKTASFLAVLGVAGAAMALALRDSLANIAGGLIIALSKPFDRGDSVEIGETRGIVLHIDVLMTTLTTEERDTVMMPNNLVSTSVVTNFTRKQKWEEHKNGQ